MRGAGVGLNRTKENDMTQDKDEMVIFNPTDTPFMDRVASIVNDPINWTLDPLTAPKPYAGGWTEIITKGEGE
jgi:hypothetical protein